MEFNKQNVLLPIPNKNYRYNLMYITGAVENIVLLVILKTRHYLFNWVQDYEYTRGDEVLLRQFICNCEDK